MVTILSYFSIAKWQRLKKYKYRLKERRIRYFPKEKKQQGRNQGSIEDINIYEECGMFEDTFETLYQNIRNNLMEPRGNGSKRNPTALQPRLRLALVLYFLRKNIHYKDVGICFKVRKLLKFIN